MFVPGPRHYSPVQLQWRHNGRDSVSNHQPRDCLLNRLFRRRSHKTSKLRVTGLCAGNSPHKWPVTRKMFQFDDVIMRKHVPLSQSNMMDCSFASKHLVLLKFHDSALINNELSHSKWNVLVRNYTYHLAKRKVRHLKYKPSYHITRFMKYPVGISISNQTQ